MDFSNEPYVRLYTRVTPTAKTYGFFGRCLLDVLVKTVDRAGVISLPDGDLFRAVAAAIDCPDVGWVRSHLPVLMEGSDPPVTVSDGFLILPRYMAAQYSTTSSACSTRMSKKKSAEIKRALELELVEDFEQKSA